MGEVGRACREFKEMKIKTGGWYLSWEKGIKERMQFYSRRYKNCGFIQRKHQECLRNAL